ncbi:MAG TPA: hypothetical protein VK982_08465 [Bacteroidales bacterium]|nr:hypothetical protein [Bacteroidales bacterium]
MKHKKIMFWDDERDIVNSLIVTLNDGWRFEEDGEHTRGFDTPKEAMKEVRSAKPCLCPSCNKK